MEFILEGFTSAFRPTKEFYWEASIIRQQKLLAASQARSHKLVVNCVGHDWAMYKWRESEGAPDPCKAQLLSNWGGMSLKRSHHPLMRSGCLDGWTETDWSICGKINGWISWNIYFLLDKCIPALLFGFWSIFPAAISRRRKRREAAKRRPHTLEWIRFCRKHQLQKHYVKGELG